MLSSRRLENEEEVYLEGASPPPPQGVLQATSLVFESCFRAELESATSTPVIKVALAGNEFSEAPINLSDYSNSQLISGKLVPFVTLLIV
jgi:hypothetical protein